MISSSIHMELIPDKEIIAVPKKPVVISNLVIWMVTAIHVCWGIALLIIDPAPHTTTLDSILKIASSHETVGLILIGTSFLAIVALLSKGHRILKLAALLPQQLFLVLSTMGAIKAIVIEQYADGVMRSASFIFIDQIYIIILGLFYMFVLFKKYVITSEPWIT